MSVYRRYFKINDKATLDAIEEFLKRRSEWNDRMKAIMDEIGATEVFAYSHSGAAAAFEFSTKPDQNKYKSVDGGYYPKKSTKEGRELVKRIESVGGFGSVNDVLKVAGIGCWRFLICEHPRAYSAYVVGSKEVGYFASIPWKDVDPLSLEKYEKDRKEKVCYDSEMVHLLWNPPKEWEEVKEWQVLKALEEAKEME